MAARLLIWVGARCLLMAGASPAAAEFAQFVMGVQNYSLPPLPYAYDVSPPPCNAPLRWTERR